MKEALPRATVIIVIAVIFFAAADLSSTLVRNVQAQGGNGIVEPADGDNVSGIVIVRGTALHPQFLRYELAFLQATRPGSDWIVFAQGDQPVQDDTLAVWDTTVGQPESPIFPDGQYRLRLRVVRDDYNYDEFFVSNVLISNLTATPTATATLTATLPITLTLPNSNEIEATRRAGTGVLPTLTPFPTPSPLPTAVGGELGAAGTQDDGLEQQGGLLNRIVEIETSRFGQAFFFGAAIVFAIFACLALYLFLRGAWRWLRRRMRERIDQ